MTALLEVEDLRKEYRAGNRTITALQGISLEIHAGEVVGLLGPNGAGKTTTVKCVCSLITPDGGRVSVGGYDPVGERIQALRQLGVVLEGSRNVYWQLSPRENLWYFGRMRGLATSVIAARSELMLQRLGLSPVADRPLKQLSRGTQQRTAVAVSLIHDPPLCLFDEPTLGLDVESSEAVVTETRRMVREEGKGVLLTTHQLELAERLCDRIAVIQGGRLLLFETKDDLLHRFEENRTAVIIITGNLAPEHRELFLSAYPGLQITEESHDDKLSLPSSCGVRPEEFFVRLWEAGYSVRLYSRKTSLHEVYLQLVSEGEQNESPQND